MSIGSVRITGQQFSKAEREPERRMAAGEGRAWDGRWEVIWGLQETDRQPVSQHGSAFLAKGQLKMPKQLLTRDSNPKSGEGRIWN